MSVKTEIQALICMCLVASLTRRVNAINCYACESIYDDNCGDDFDLETFFKVDCEHSAPPRYLQNDLESWNSTACMKKIFKENGEKRVVRSCFYGEVNDTVLGCRSDPMLLNIEEIACHVCDNENYCNQASTQYITIEKFIFMLLIFISYRLLHSHDAIS